MNTKSDVIEVIQQDIGAGYQSEKWYATTKVDSQKKSTVYFEEEHICL